MLENSVTERPWTRPYFVSTILDRAAEDVKVHGEDEVPAPPRPNLESDMNPVSFFGWKYDGYSGDRSGCDCDDVGLWFVYGRMDSQTTRRG